MRRPAARAAPQIVWDEAPLLLVADAVDPAVFVPDAVGIALAPLVALVSVAREIVVELSVGVEEADDEVLEAVELLVG